MNTTTKWLCVGGLAMTGIVAFACGGSDTPPPNTGTTSATTAASSAPDTSATAAASSAAPSASTPVAPPAPPLVVAAMKLSGASLKKPVELKDDGSIMVDGKPVAKIVGAEFQDGSGKTILAVAADGSLKVPGVDSAKGMKFNGKDELEVADGAKLVIGDDGVVKMLNPDGKADKDSGKMKFTGFKPTARRAATVLVMGMMMPTTTTTTAATASASAALTAKPPAKKP